MLYISIDEPSVLYKLWRHATSSSKQREETGWKRVRRKKQSMDSDGKQVPEDKMQAQQTH